MSQEGILLNLHKGLDSEYRALEACKSLAEILDDEADKAAVLGIMHDEESHIKITENLIELTKQYYGN